MTAQSLTGNFSKFGTYFLHKLRSIRSLFILNAIFALFSYPTALGLCAAWADVSLKTDKIAERYQYEYDLMHSDEEWLRLTDLSYTLEGLFIAALIIGVIMLILMFVMNYIVSARSFRWLYDKTVVDMDYSLPVSDDTRFFGDLLASLAATTIPHLIAIIIGSIIAATLPKELYEVIPVGLFEQVAYSGLFSCIMFMGSSLLIVSLCGRSAEARIYPFVLNVAVPVIHAVCMSIVLSNAYGYSTYGGIDEYMSVAYTSPLGLIAITFLAMIYSYDSYNVVSIVGEEKVEILMPMFRAEILIPLILVTLAMFVGAYFLIKYRRAERVGSPYVYAAVKHIIPAVVMFAITSGFSWFIFNAIKESTENPSILYSTANHPEGYIVAWLVLTFVLYIIMELISGKGFKKFYITVGKYVVTVAASFGICAALFYSNGMGIAEYVPAADSVVRAELHIFNFNNFNGHLSSEVTDAENIEKIVEFHRDIPKNGPETDRVDYDVNITYNLKDGSIVARNYYISKERYEQALQQLTSPEQYYSSLNIADVADIWFNGEDSEYYKEQHITAVAVDGMVTECTITMEELDEAFRKDCENVTYEKVYGTAESEYVEFRHNRTEMYSSMSYSTFQLKVYDWYENVIALLESKGVSLFDQEDLSIYKTAFIIEYDVSDGDLNEINNTDVVWLMGAAKGNIEEALEFYSEQGYNINDYYEKFGEEGYDQFLEEYFGNSNASVKQLDISNDKVKQLLNMSTETISGVYSSDVIYKLFLTDATTIKAANEYVFNAAEFYVTEDNLAKAAEIFNSIN